MGFERVYPPPRPTPDPNFRGTMADDEIPNDEPGDEPDVVIEDEEFDGEEFVDEEVFVEVEVDEDAVVVVDVEEADDEPVVRGRKKPAKDEEEADDEDELDPDDVEADLDAILKDRIAANADDDEEDEAEEVVAKAPDTPDGVVPKKANEFMCTGCFLLVNRAQFGPAGSLECPVGESVCPAIEVLTQGTKKK